MGFSVRRWRAFAIMAVTLIFGIHYFLNASRDFGLDEQPKSKPHSSHNKPPDDGKIHWKKLPESYPVDKLTPLPKGKPVSIPTIQANAKPEDAAAKVVRLKRLAAVKESFTHSWQGYKKHAWLRDEVIPVAGGYRDKFGGWAASLVDALDTLWIMGLKDEFEQAVNALHEIDFTTTDEQAINVFETTIRYLGGFLAAYDISGAKYPILLQKATEVGDFLMCAFDTPNRMPISRWPWKSYLAGDKQVAPSSLLVSELGSLSLEFTRLSQLTGDLKYYDAVQRISDLFEHTQNTTQLPGMWPVMIDAQTPDMSTDSAFTLGGMSDSLYEYLPKQYLLLGGLLDQPKKMYNNFIDVAKKHLFFRALNPSNFQLLFSGDVRAYGEESVQLNPVGQHLGCFTGGMVGIAAKIFNRPQDIEIAEQLTNGCVWAYDAQNTGVAPEIFDLVPCSDNCTWSTEAWHAAMHDAPDDPMLRDAFIRERNLKPGFTAYADKRYILRPEAIESVFIMWRISGDKKWQDIAWRMFTKIEQATRTHIAASAIYDVTVQKPTKMDSMESFWLAETLKYFYLCFEERGVVNLDEWVLNTEAHPLRRPK